MDLLIQLGVVHMCFGLLLYYCDKYYDQNQLRSGKGLFKLILTGHSPLLKEAEVGAQAIIEAGTMEKRSFLAFSLDYAELAFYIQFIHPYPSLGLLPPIVG